MSLILNIETATKNCSVALAENGKTIALEEIALESFSHAEKLHVFIENVLTKANKFPKNLNAIAVSCGPGSYTGLRIGVSAAKGLCFALDLPLIAIDTLTVLAQQLMVSEGKIIPMIDARRMEVFLAVYNDKLEKIRKTQAEIIDETYLAKENDIFHLIGDGAIKFENILTDKKFRFYPEILYPSATNMGFLSFEKFSKNEFEDLAYFEPFYLKDFTLPQKQ